MGDGVKPKSEGRNPKSRTADRALPHFGLRISAFFRISDLGFRVYLPRVPLATRLGPTYIRRDV
jgi:hypothetical protein